MAAPFQQSLWNKTKSINVCILHGKREDGLSQVLCCLSFVLFNCLSTLYNFHVLLGLVFGVFGGLITPAYSYMLS